MNENELRSRGHSGLRTFLRIAGPIAVLGGLCLVGIGLAHFTGKNAFSVTPVCMFAGLSLLFVGGAMCMFGYMGTVQRYIAGESAPVAKDVVNYMGENIQPGVKAVAKAVAEGLGEGQRAKSENPQPAPPGDTEKPST